MVRRSDIPKLFINAGAGMIRTGSPREFCRTWRNREETTVAGHFIQKDSLAAIGQAVAAFVSRTS